MVEQDCVSAVKTLSVTVCTFAIVLLFSTFRNSGYEMAFLKKKLTDFVPLPIETQI